jgi:hypothetical protein
MATFLMGKHAPVVITPLLELPGTRHLSQLEP